MFEGRFFAFVPIPGPPCWLGLKYRRGDLGRPYAGFLAPGSALELLLSRALSSGQAILNLLDSRNNWKSAGSTVSIERTFLTS